MTSPLDTEARNALDGYLTTLAKALSPHRVIGVHLTGSAVLGDWQPGRSDLDILTVTDGPLTSTEMAALAELHSSLDDAIHCDAVYVTRDVLGRPSETSFPYTVDGEFHSDGYTVDPVLWATLHRHGETLRGVDAAELGAEPDASWLRDWNVGNLQSYWLATAVEARPRVAGRVPSSPASTYVTVWMLTGPGRLHHTIATGGIISKTAAADYTAELFPSHADLLARAKAWRLGDESVSFTSADAVQVLDLVVAIVHAAITMASAGCSGSR